MMIMMTTVLFEIETRVHGVAQTQSFFVRLPAVILGCRSKFRLWIWNFLFHPKISNCRASTMLPHFFRIYLYYQASNKTSYTKIHFLTKILYQNCIVESMNYNKYIICSISTIFSFISNITLIHIQEHKNPNNTNFKNIT